eukprot:scaffold2631_cov412-Prasinococcus_capsulatus_cf.AAC.22
MARVLHGINVHGGFSTTKLHEPRHRMPCGSLLTAPIRLGCVLFDRIVDRRSSPAPSWKMALF